MIVAVKRSGGFAGVEQNLGQFDTKALSAADAALVEDLVAEMVRRQKAGAKEPIGADMFRYVIEVRDESGKPQTLEVLDEDDPESRLQRLLQLLRLAV